MSDKIDEQWDEVSDPSSSSEVHTENPSSVSLPEAGTVCDGAKDRSHDSPARPSAAVDPPTLVTWDGPNDPENPQTWPVRRKWILTISCTVMSLCVTFGSSAPTHHYGFISGIRPGLFGPASELIGRRPIFILSMVCYTLFHLGQSLAQNFETLIVTRFLAGCFAIAPLTNTGGLIADLWDAKGRGAAANIFASTLFMGPVLGPVVGGYVIQSDVTWRWIFWVMMIFSGFSTVVSVCIPETYAPVLLQNKAKRLRKADPQRNANLYAQHEREDWSWKGVMIRTICRPIKMLLLEPILVLTTLYLSMVYGLLYGLFEAFPIIFGEKRGFSIGSTGLTFIGMGIGTIAGCFITHCITHKYYSSSLLQKWRGFPPPEERLYGAMIASPLLVIGIFWLGWSGAYPGVHWIVPELATVIIGACLVLTFHSFLTYTVDVYLMYSASALAANTMIRSCFAAAFPLFTVQMFHKLGTQWAATLLGLIALLLGPSAFLFYKYGVAIRTRSKFAPSMDLKIAEIIRQEEEKAKDLENSIEHILP